MSVPATPPTWSVGTCPKCNGAGQSRIPTQQRPSEYYVVQCSQCNGWGYVRDVLDLFCIHSWDSSKTIGNCLTLYSCSKCPRTWEVDSSG